MRISTVIDEAERGGYEVVAVEKAYNRASGVGLQLRGQTYALKVYELRDRLALTEAEVERWKQDNRYRLSYRDEEPPKTRPIANGRLALSIEHSYGSGRRSNWREGPRGSLESKLASVFDELEERSREDEREALRRAAEREAWAREQEERRERARVAQIESACGERLSAEVRAWREAEESRAYVGALRQRLSELDPAERERIARWLDWAEAWIAKSDPVITTQRIRGLSVESDATAPHTRA